MWKTKIKTKIKMGKTSARDKHVMFLCLGNGYSNVSGFRVGVNMRDRLGVVPLSGWNGGVM